MEELVRWNERYRAWGNFADNTALASIIASVAQILDIRGVDGWVALGSTTGLAFLWLGYYVRGLIHSEA